MNPAARKPRALLFGAVIFALASISAESAVLIVSNTQDSGAGSLRATVAVASAGDTIEFSIPTGDPGYDSSTGVFTITLTSGEIVIDKDLNIAALADQIAISGNHASRVFNITAGAVAISNLSFINGTAKGADGSLVGFSGLPGIGGAVLNRGTLVMTRCTFEGNTAIGGRGAPGGIAAPTGGYGQGGAIANQNTLSLIECTLAGNLAAGGQGGVGGMTIPHSGTGGTGSGGSVYNAAAATLSLKNCTLTANSAEGADASPSGLGGEGAPAQGGGVANFGTLTIEHCTVANNEAHGGDAYPGGITFDGGAASGGGLFGAAGSVSFTRNTIFAPNKVVGGAPNNNFGHIGSATGPDVNGAVTSQGHNLLGRSDGCTGFTADDLQGGTTEDTRLDPKLGTLANNGGSTKTLSLLSGSPAIDAADTAPPNRDQRNFLRAGVPDIGAFEFQGAQPVYLANISTRLRVRPGDNAMIGGFIITGMAPKTVVVRALGPSLPVPDALADPIIEVRGPSGQVLGANDNWREALTSQEIIGSGLEPSNDLESALWGTINPGAYTVIVRGKNDAAGVALFEVYDLDQTVDSKLGNVATRGFVETGDNVMIGGTIITGTAPRILFRAIGPSLTNFGVSNALGDPTLELYDGNGGLIAINYDWRDDQEAEIITAGLPPSNDLESAIVRDLAPGNYTAIVRGLNNTTGIAVVEAYNLN